MLVALYAAVACVTVLRHEMWRDEIHAWQVVAAADSLVELAGNVRFEGHPALWFILLYPLSRVTADPVAMQILHVAIAIAVAAVVLHAAPLPLGTRALVAFGYFPLYEYSAISRNYAVGALLLFIFCALFDRRDRRPLVLAVVLVLLAQASAVALVVSFALGLMWIADWWTSRRTTATRHGPAGAALALWVLGIVVSVVQLAPARSIMRPMDVERISEPSRVVGVLSTPWQGYVPLPNPKFGFWNSNILDAVAGGEALQAVLGIALFCALASLFLRCAPVLLLFVVGSGGLLAFSMLIYKGHLRHHGHYLLLLLAALWLSRVLQSGARGREGARKDRDGPPRLGMALVGGLLAINVIAGVYAVAREWRDPFSAGRETARFIRSQGLAGLPIVGHRDVETATVAGYLGRALHSPSLGHEVFLVPWITDSRREVDDAEAVRQARALATERRSEALIVFSMSGPRRPERIDGATRIRGFSRSIVPSERFELYLVPPGEAANAE